MKTREVVLAFLLGVAVVSGLPSLAGADELDPIVAQVVEMLEAGVSDELILQWLESTGRRPRDVGSQGLIALTGAGAAERLVSRLLELVGETTAAETTDAPRPTKASEATTAADSGEARSTRPAGDGRVEIRIELAARQIWVQEDEPDAPRPDPLEVFLYLDGQYAARVKPSLRGEPIEFRRPLAPGRHELRLLVETHAELRRGWRHESLVVPTSIAFDAEPEEPLEIALRLNRSWELGRPGSDGPLSYAVRQGDRLLTEREGTGGRPDEWRHLCEDVEANFPAAEEVPLRFRSQMSRCVRWATLWSGDGDTSSREELLAWMAEYDYRPPVR